MSAGPEDRDTRLPETTEEAFLSRWSRRKQEARRTEVELRPKLAADEPVPELPPVDQLTPDSDYHAFLHPKVSEDVRRAALKKLFSDPHFNVMDGLDVYIDDYSKSEPIPPAMLAGLRQAQNILQWAKEDEEKRKQEEEKKRLAAAGARPEAPDSLPAPLPDDPASKPAS